MEILKEYRDKIDDIDKKIVELFEQRLDVVKKIGEVKRKNEIPIVSEHREAIVVKQAILNLKNKEYSEEVTEYMNAIIGISRRLQEKFKER